jgi:hypothetical protein
MAVIRVSRNQKRVYLSTIKPNGIWIWKMDFESSHTWNSMEKLLYNITSYHCTSLHNANNHNQDHWIMSRPVNKSNSRLQCLWTTQDFIWREKRSSSPGTSSFGTMVFGDRMTNNLRSSTIWVVLRTMISGLFLITVSTSSVSGDGKKLVPRHLLGRPLWHTLMPSFPFFLRWWNCSVMNVRIMIFQLHSDWGPIMPDFLLF